MWGSASTDLCHWEGLLHVLVQCVCNNPSLKTTNIRMTISSTSFIALHHISSSLALFTITITIATMIKRIKMRLGTTIPATRGLHYYYTCQSVNEHIVWRFVTSVKLRHLAFARGFAHFSRLPQNKHVDSLSLLGQVLTVSKIGLIAKDRLAWPVIVA